MRTLTGEIRMLKWGIIPNEPSFQISVDQKVGGRSNLIVTEIVPEPINDGVVEYHIQCAKFTMDNDKLIVDDERFVWKTYTKKPDEIQYFIPDEKHNYLKI